MSLRGRGIGGTGGGTSGGNALEVRVTQSDLRDLTRAINRHGDAKAVKKALRAGLREAVKPLVPVARARVLGQATKGRGSTGLRADMARAVQVKVDIGGRDPKVALRLDGKKLRGRPAGLVGMYEGVVPWRHPVFGTGTWVQQPARGFLTEVGRSNEARIGRAVFDVMDDIGRKIDKGV